MNRKRKTVQAKRQSRRNIHRILDAVLDINELQANKKICPVYLNFFGFSRSFVIELYKDWNPDLKPIQRYAAIHRRLYEGEISLSEMADWLEKERERLA